MRACLLAAGLWISGTAFASDLTLAAQDLPPPQQALPQVLQQVQQQLARQQASPTAQSPDNSNSFSAAFARLHDLTGRASELAVQALSMLGINYRYGGTSPETGLDCSGLVQYVFKEAWGTDLPRTAAEISHVGEKVGKSDLRPGDLVFYNTLRRSFSHVGIYLGDGKFIHSPSTGGQVRIESMDVSYWKKRFNGARRIAAEDNNAEIR